MFAYAEYAERRTRDRPGLVPAGRDDLVRTVELCLDLTSIPSRFCESHIAIPCPGSSIAVTSTVRIVWYGSAVEQHSDC